jgi:2-desacetyl-2-hydroxyethyl bacteriochlorophyllide A dehydrogenase
MDARVTLPAVLGHEMSGTIASVGEGVSDWSVGDRVTVMPLDWCGHCPACLSGNTHICHNLNFLGIDSPGSMQENWTVPARAVIALPPAVSLEAGALAEPTAVAVHDVRRSGLVAGEKTVVVGGGPIGVLIACVARATGGEVLVLELSESRRTFIDKLGLRAIDPTDGDVQALIADWTGGAGAAVTFEVSGAVAGLETAIQAATVRGRVVVVAIHAAPPPVNLFRVFWRELTLIGARLYQRTDFEEALRLIEGGAVPAALMITGIAPLDDVASAFSELESGRPMKMLIDCHPAG